MSLPSSSALGIMPPLPTQPSATDDLIHQIVASDGEGGWIEAHSLKKGQTPAMPPASIPVNALETGPPRGAEASALSVSLSSAPSTIPCTIPEKQVSGDDWLAARYQTEVPKQIIQPIVHVQTLSVSTQQQNDLFDMRKVPELSRFMQRLSPTRVKIAFYFDAETGKPSRYRTFDQFHFAASSPLVSEKRIYVELDENGLPMIDHHLFSLVVARLCIHRIANENHPDPNHRPIPFISQCMIFDRFAGLGEETHPMILVRPLVTMCDDAQLAFVVCGTAHIRGDQIAQGAFQIVKFTSNSKCTFLSLHPISLYTPFRL